MKQATFDFHGTRRSARRSQRRAIVLTANARDYASVARAGTGDEVAILAVNDIVSTTRGEEDGPHHEIRRTAMVRRAIAGGHSRVLLRNRMGVSIPCRVIEVYGEDDDSANGMIVARI